MDKWKLLKAPISEYFLASPYDTRRLWRVDLQGNGFLLGEQLFSAAFNSKPGVRRQISTASLEIFLVQGFVSAEVSVQFVMIGITIVAD